MPLPLFTATCDITSITAHWDSCIKIALTQCKVKGFQPACLQSGKSKLKAFHKVGTFNQFHFLPVLSNAWSWIVAIYCNWIPSPLWFPSTWPNTGILTTMQDCCSYIIHYDITLPAANQQKREAASEDQRGRLLERGSRWTNDDNHNQKTAFNPCRVGQTSTLKRASLYFILGSALSS